VRTAEVVYIGDAASLVRASREAAVATESATASISKAHGRVEASSARASASVSKFGKDMAIAGVAAAGAAVDMALKVEHAAGRIAASSGTSVAAAKKITDAFESTRGSAIFSAAKIGEAYAKVAGELGFVEGHALKSSEAMKVMHAAMDLAEASGGQLNETTEALGKTMLVFHLRAGRAAEAADVLFTASKKTGNTIEATAEAIQKIHGRLGVLAPSLRETGGLMVEMASHGIKGREALAALNGVFNTLIGGGKKTEDMLKKLGVHIFDHSGKFIGLRNVIAQLSPVLAKYDQQSQLAATHALFGANANKKLLDIIHEGPAAFERATRAVAKHGAAHQAAEAHSKTFAGQLEKLKAASEDLGAAIGKALIPVLEKLVGVTKDVVTWLKHHETAAKALAGVITTVLGVALTVYAFTKAKQFVNATKDMINAMKAL